MLCWCNKLKYTKKVCRTLNLIARLSKPFLPEWTTLKQSLRKTLLNLYSRFYLSGQLLRLDYYLAPWLETNVRERTTLKQSPSKKAGKQWQFCHLHETKNRLEVLARFNFCSFRTQDFGSWLLNFEILPQRHTVLLSMFERPRCYLISHWKTRVGRDLKLERFTLSCSTCDPMIPEGSS